MTGDHKALAGDGPVEELQDDVQHLVVIRDPRLAAGPPAAREIEIQAPPAWGRPESGSM